MNKLALSGLLVLTAAVAGAQTATTPWNFSIGARYRLEDSAYSDLSNRKQFSHVRIRPLLTYDGGNGSKVVLEGQYVKVMGKTYLQPTSTTANTSTETSGNSSYMGGQDTLWMRQAYLDVKLSDELNLLLGRQAMAYGDQLIIGVSNWNLYGRSFDAAKLQWKQDKTSVDVFQAVINEATETTSADRDDKTLYGFYASHGFNETIKTLDLYYFYLSDARKSATGPSNQHFGDYGTRVVTAFGNWEWKFEYAQNFGTEGTAFMSAGEDTENNMIDTTLSTKMGDSRIAFEIFKAGKNWRELYATTASVLGITDVVGRRNITGAAVHHNAKWSDLWSTDISLFYFTRTDNKEAVYATNGTTTRGDATESARDVGTELDLAAKYKLNKDTTLTASVSVFEYGQYFRDSANVDDKKKPVYSYFMVETKF